MSITFPKNKKIILGGVLAFVLLILLVIFLERPVENASRPDQKLNISAFGYLPSLDETMQNDADVNALIQKILLNDEAKIFVNYRQINNDIATLLFFWSGMTRAEVQEFGGRGAINEFLRRVYGLPDDEPIVGNPLLKSNPWADLFNRFKAQILMQGRGHNIYDGLAYFDNELDQMVVRANLSEEFIHGFAEFLKTQDDAKRQKYFNNFLLFVRDTKGFNNLSKQDKELINVLKEAK